MSGILALVLLLAALVGHAGVWIYAVNWLHSTRLYYRIAKGITVILRAILLGVPLAFVWYVFSPPRAPADLLNIGNWRETLPTPVLIYLGVCVLVACGPVAAGALRRITFRAPSQLAANHTQQVAFSRREFTGSGAVSQLVRLPGNQSVQLHIAEKRLSIAGLDPRLQGLRIAHLSDLHFTGRIRREFFERVVAYVAQAKPDLVVIAGDLVDRDACIDWVPEILGKLTAPLGVFAVLGNHDLRVDVARLRNAIEEAGIELISDRFVTLEHNGGPLLLAGNELPWFEPAADMSDVPSAINGARPLRILLSHSPDQISWAKEREFDLMLAGHTHGGQIRLPLWGPLVAPSKYGTKYASGTFFEPPTLLHVSRGISGKLPLRLNCPPELPILILEADSATTD